MLKRDQVYNTEMGKKLLSLARKQRRDLHRTVFARYLDEARPAELDDAEWLTELWYQESVRLFSEEQVKSNGAAATNSPDKKSY